MSLDLSVISDHVKHWAVTAFCACIFAYFVIHSVMGANGLFTMMDMRHQIMQSKLELQDMQKEKQAMETRTRLLRPDSLDLDMLDERARALLGYTKPNEYVIYYKD